MLDSYAAHYSKEVRTHLTKNPNVKLALILGSLTPILQQLDYTINVSFKRATFICRIYMQDFQNLYEGFFLYVG